MNSILVPVEGVTSAHSQLVTAILSAAQFGAYIDGIAPQFRIEPYLLSPGVGGVILTIGASLERIERARVKALEESFRSFMQGHSVTWIDRAGRSKRMTANWISEAVINDEELCRIARIYDLTVLPGVTEPARAANTRLLLDKILSCSGRPILIAPPEAPEHVGIAILVAWNDSVESARTMAVACPFLSRASQVALLSADADMLYRPGVSHVRRALCRAGIPVHVLKVGGKGRLLGEAILSEANDMNADLVVKGAYTHRRVTHLIFGSATNQILMRARVPILMTC